MKEGTICKLSDKIASAPTINFSSQKDISKDNVE